MDEQQSDGLLYISKDKICFKPETFPTKFIKSYGFTWENGSWCGDLNFDNINFILDTFPNCKVDDQVHSWMSGETAVRIWEHEEYGEDLYAFQREAIGFMLDKSRCMLALAPGLGKTACAIHAAKVSGGNTLVISPLSLVRNWKKEIKKWVGDEAHIWHGETHSPKQWVITNYETALYRMVTYDEKKSKNKNGKTVTRKVRWRLSGDFYFDNVIVDESILIKNRKAQRTQAVKTIAKEAKNVWMLSGSPVSKFFDDMWSQLNVLDSKRFSSYWRFAKKYTVVEEGYWGWVIRANERGASVQIRRDLQDIYFSRTQDQVLDIPDWLFDTIEIEMTAEQTRLYKEMEDQFLAILPDGDVVLAPNILTQLLRLVQFASNPILVGGEDAGAKWDALPELLDFVEKPAIIWTHFRETANNIESKLAETYSTDLLTGATPSGLRQTIVDDFQAGKYEILIANPGVGKFGHTLTAAKTAIYLERSYNGDDYYQSLYRIKRIGTAQSPYVIHLLSARPNSDEPTVDHVIDQILKYRKDNSIAITSGLIREYFKG